jgi:hypothetical protein
MSAASPNMAAMELVSTTRLTDGVRPMPSSTLRVPSSAGSTRSRWGSSTLRTKGEAVWMTTPHPAIASS